MAKQSSTSAASSKRNVHKKPKYSKFNPQKYVPNTSTPRAKAPKPEKKGMDTPINFQGTPIVATTNTNDSCVVLNLVQAGTGSWNRVGRKIHSQSLRLKGTLRMEQKRQTTSSDLFGNVVRMVVVWDKQPSSNAIPAFSDVFGHTLQSGTEATVYTDALKYDNMDRFKILREFTVTCNPTTANVAGGTGDKVYYLYAYDEYIKLKNLETVFSGQSNPMTISDISSGALYLYARAELQQDEAFFVDTANSFARLRYTD